jgi:hypothetical protein
LSQTVRPWIHDEGLSHQLSYAWDELETIRRLVTGIQGSDGYRAALRSLTKESNEELFRLVEESSLAFEQGDRSTLDPTLVSGYCEETVAQLISLRNNFISENIYLLMDSLNQGCADGPVLAPQIH